MLMLKNKAYFGFYEFVILMAALNAVNALSIDVMLPALPEIGKALDVHDESARQWIITTYVLGTGFGQLVFGIFSDRFGRRRVLLCGLALYVLSSIGAMSANSFATLLAFRAVQGICGASANVIARSIIRDRHSGPTMARVLSLTMLVFLAVPIAAPAIGQVILLMAPWEALFALLVAAGTLVMIWVFVRLPETLPQTSRRRIDLSNLAEGARITLATPASIGYALAMTSMTGALVAYIISLPQIFGNYFGAAAAMPTAFAIGAAGMALASLGNARIVGRLGTRVIAHIALLGFIATASLHAVIVLADLETLELFTTLQALTMIGFSLSVPNFSAMAMEPVGKVAGMAASLHGLLSTLVGAMLGAAIGQQFDGTPMPFLLGCIGCGTAALLAVLYAERGRLFRQSAVQ